MKKCNRISLHSIIFFLSFIFSLSTTAFCEFNSVNQRNFLGDRMKTDETADDGVHKFIVNIVPGDHQGINGYVHIPVIQSSFDKQTVSDEMKGLVSAINQYTAIKAQLDPSINLDSSRLNKYPFLYLGIIINTDPTETEKNNFQAYIGKGGFVVFDYLHNIKILFGERAKSAPVPLEHPIYHCFYDFKKGQLTNLSKEAPEDTLFIGNELSGIWIGDKLVGLNNLPSGLWSDKNINSKDLKIGINILVYSLLR